MNIENLKEKMIKEHPDVYHDGVEPVIDQYGQCSGSTGPSEIKVDNEFNL
jgi:hypothetical protein